MQSFRNSTEATYYVLIYSARIIESLLHGVVSCHNTIIFTDLVGVIVVNIKILKEFNNKSYENSEFSYSYSKFILAAQISKSLPK